MVSSLADNFPNTALECVGAGVPLLVSNVGGIPEIIDPADRENVCFEPRPDVLAERIRSALEQGAFSARPSASFADTEGNWVRWHAGLSNRAKNEQPARKERARWQRIYLSPGERVFRVQREGERCRSHFGVAEAARLSAPRDHLGRMWRRGFVGVKGIAPPGSETTNCARFIGAVARWARPEMPRRVRRKGNTCSSSTITPSCWRLTRFPSSFRSRNA